MAMASPAVVFVSRVVPGVAAGPSGAFTPRDCSIPKTWQSSSVLNSQQWSLHTLESRSARSRRRLGSTTARRPTTIKAAVKDVNEKETVDFDWDVERRWALRPVMERFNIHHEQNVSAERLQELGVSRWSKWDCGPGVTYFWHWQADELVYISKGSVEVVPDGCYDGAFFYAGDIVRFPKWLEASLTFDEDYEQHYTFLAYGD